MIFLFDTLNMKGVLTDVLLINLKPPLNLGSSQPAMHNL